MEGQEAPLPGLDTRKIAQRYRRRLAPERGSLDALLDALKTLLQVTGHNDPFFLARGLELLWKHLEADQAYLVTIEDVSLAAQWWVPEVPGQAAPRCVPGLCRWLLENPHRTLVVPNVARDLNWKEDPDLVGMGIGAVAATTVWCGLRPRGMVFLIYSQPHPFSRTQLALLQSVAGVLGHLLEVEELKQSLEQLENALAITRAVVEDSSIEDPASHLPNLRYLEIWLAANLSVKVREREIMTVAEWELDPGLPDLAQRIKETAARVRGGDLLVSMGHGRFLLVLQRATQSMGDVFLRRLLPVIGCQAMGATLWVPGVDDTAFESVRKRLSQALEQANRPAKPGLVWRLAKASLGQ